MTTTNILINMKEKKKLFFGGTRIWSQDLTLAKPTPSPFCFSYFSDKITLLCGLTTCLEIPPSYDSYVAGLIGTIMPPCFLLLRWGLVNFLSGPTLNHDLCLLCIWDYSHEPLYPSTKWFLKHSLRKMRQDEHEFETSQGCVIRRFQNICTCTYYFQFINSWS
jgi:hypothetical protein